MWLSFLQEIQIQFIFKMSPSTTYVRVHAWKPPSMTNFSAIFSTTVVYSGPAKQCLYNLMVFRNVRRRTGGSTGQPARATGSPPPARSMADTSQPAGTSTQYETRANTSPPPARSMAGTSQPAGTRIQYETRATGSPP